MSSLSSSKASGVSQYLTFTLAGECYAVDVQNAQTVIEHSRVTKVPRTPQFMMGVINFRGRVVPLLDLRIKLGIEGHAQDVEASDYVIVILDLTRDGENLTLGVRVDEVREVIDLDAELIERTPSVGNTSDLRFMRGVARKENEFLLVLDAEQILETEERARLSEHVPVA